MKALTLTEPWATLVALKQKRIETRSWSTDYRGPLAIHAAKSFPDWAKRLCVREPFCTALNERPADDLPTGVVVCTCRLEKVEQILMFTELPADPEFSFGDYTVGRFMWFLTDITPLKVSVKARGSLSLWEWDGAVS